MNNKKNYDIKLIKQKINATFQLLDEIQQLAEELNISDNHLVDVMDDLESLYWDIEDMEQDIQD